MGELHCWKDRRTHIAETEGYGSKAYWASYSDGECDATCMLPRDHAGPHEWTHDSRISITFAPGETP